MKHFAGDLSWPELIARLESGDPLVLGIGAFEQHGPHLPLSTDTLIVSAFAEAIADSLGGMVLPTLPYGAASRPRSGGGDLFAAPALPLELLLPAVRALVQGALQARATRLVVVSWHWENAAVLWDAIQPLFGGDAVAVLIDNPAGFLARDLRDELFPDGFPGWDGEHAGRLETALVRYLVPELVGSPELPAPHRPRLLDVLPTPADAAPANGVFVDATGVTAELGERSFRSIAASLTEAIRTELAT